MPYPDSEYPPAPQGHAPSGTFADMEKRHIAGLTERDLRSRQRLLAAAPEMLALCKLLRQRLADLVRHVDEDTDSDADLAHDRDAVDDADAVIAKAEGRE